MSKKFLDEDGLKTLVSNIKAGDKSITDSIGTVPSGKTVEGQITALEATHATDTDGSYKTVANEASTAATNAVSNLNATITSSDADAYVTVKVTEASGKITAVNVTNVLTPCTEDEITALFSTED